MTRLRPFGDGVEVATEHENGFASSSRVTTWALHQPLAEGLRHGACARVDVQLGIDIPDVTIDGVRAEGQPRRDLLLRQPVHELVEDLALAT